MFNAFEQVQRQKKEALFKKRAKIENYIEKQRRDNNDALSQKYSKRIEYFVHQMNEKPVFIEDYAKKPKYQARDENPESFIGGSSFIIKGFKTEQDRIREFLKYRPKQPYINYDAKMHQFRDRDPSKDIQPEMHFANKYAPTVLAKKGILKSEENLPTHSKHHLAALISPHHHQKNVRLHFKAAQSFSFGFDDSVGKRMKAKLNKGDNNNIISNDGLYYRALHEIEQYDQEADGMLSSDHDAHKEAFDKVKKENKKDLDETPRTLSKNMLIKCGILNKTRANFIRCGEGHYLSVPQQKIKDTYNHIIQHQI